MDDHSVTDQPRTALHLVDDPARPVCVHHWVLGDPANGTVDGRCKRCGAARAFSGTPDEAEELQESRMDSYLSLIEKWQQIARRMKNV